MENDYVKSHDRMVKEQEPDSKLAKRWLFPHHQENVAILLGNGHLVEFISDQDKVNLGISPPGHMVNMIIGGREVCSIM
ncbi:hypothetical protein HAX54_048664, partial [Datura stramonium]|nr:hypothetical protein [Datura stramonium]